MNRKGLLFSPLMVFGLIILLGTSIVLVNIQKEKTKQEYSIGQLQSQIINNYYESEKIYYYYEKLLDYNEYKTVKEFAGKGGVPEICKKRWEFNSNCEPNFEKQFEESLSKNLKDKYKELKIDQKIEVYFTDFDFPSGSNTAEVNYKGKIVVKKQPLIKFNDLDKLKLDIKNCIQNNKINDCSPESINGNMYHFKRKVADILNENLEKEEIFLEFDVDSQNSGLRTTIF